MRKTSLSAGLSDGTVKAIFANPDQSPRYETICSLAQALGCAVADLTGDYPTESRNQVTRHEMDLSGAAEKLKAALLNDPALPQATLINELLTQYDALAQRTALGSLLQSEADFEEPSRVEQTGQITISRSGGSIDTFWMRALSNSMNLRGILPGDYLNVSPSHTAATGDIVIVRINDGRNGHHVVLRELVTDRRKKDNKRKSTLFLTPHSTDQQFQSIEMTDMCERIGVVLHVLRTPTST